jgi:hypothetical protein
MAEIGKPNGSKLNLSNRRDLHCYSRLQFNLEQNPHLGRNRNELEVTWECVAASRKQDWNVIPPQPYSPLSSRLAPMPGASPVGSSEKSHEDSENYEGAKRRQPVHSLTAYRSRHAIWGHLP